MLTEGEKSDSYLLLCRRNHRAVQEIVFARIQNRQDQIGSGFGAKAFLAYPNYRGGGCVFASQKHMEIRIQGDDNPLLLSGDRENQRIRHREGRQLRRGECIDPEGSS
jgi:hypothetical protein